MCDIVLWHMGQRELCFQPNILKVYPYVFGLITVKTGPLLSAKVHTLLVIICLSVEWWSKPSYWMMG